MLEVLVSDPSRAAAVRSTAAAMAAARPALSAYLRDSDTVFASPGVFLPHLHGECAGGPAELAAAGVTSWTLGVFGLTLDAIERDLVRLARSPLASGGGFRGVFLEGPFVAFDGAMDFDLRVLTDFLDAAPLRIDTLAFAPERVDAGALLPLLTKRGIHAAVAHTRADFDVCADAFARGARLLALPFAATPALHHRSPGPIGAAANAGAVCEVPVALPGFTRQMGGFVAAAFKDRAVPVYHPAVHPRSAAEHSFPAGFAARAARTMGLGTRDFLSIYNGCPSPRNTFVLFDRSLTVLMTVGGGEAVFELKGARR